MCKLLLMVNLYLQVTDRLDCLSVAQVGKLIVSIGIVQNV